MDTLQSLIDRYLPPNRAQRLFWVVLIAIFYLAFAPRVDIGPDFHQADKLKHASAFAVLAMLLQRGYRPNVWRSVVALLGIGIFIEIVQAFLPYRDASVYDLMADGLGMAVGLWAICRLKLTTSVRFDVSE